jgi:hypothetical protein
MYVFIMYVFYLSFDRSLHKEAESMHTQDIYIL